MTTITEELRDKGIDASKFERVYNIVRAVSDVNLPLLSVPGVYSGELQDIFGYLTDSGVLKKRRGDVYKVNNSRREVMEKRIEAGELKIEVAPRIHGE